MSAAKANITTVEHIPEIRDRLRASFASGKTLDVSYRKNQLLQLCYLLKENTERFHEAFRADLGRPPQETSMAEIDGVIGEAIYAYKNVDKWVKPESAPFGMTFGPMTPGVIKQPKGTVLIIGPFNYPVSCALEPLVGAISAGCTAVIKLSELVPTISALVTELWPKYMDEDLYEIVNGGIPETTALLDLQWDHILFTGSGTVGRIVAAAAAKHLTPTTLELGGQCPVFFDAANTDLAISTHRILWGRTMNAGQTCLSPNHVFVPSEHQDKVVDAFVKTYHEFYPDGALKSESVSKIVTDGHFQRLKGMLDSTKGTIVAGGETDEKNRFIAPTVVRDVGVDDALLKSEIFGPILPIVPVKDFDEAIQITNSKDHPLALYAFSDNPQFKERVFRSTQSGAACANDVCIHMAVPGVPFGGVGPSGMGSYTGKFGFDAFTHLRATLDNPRWTDLLFSWRYPPYTAKTFKQATSLAPSIPAPRPGPGIAPVTRSGWFSWVGHLILRRRRNLVVLLTLVVVLNSLNRHSLLPHASRLLSRR